MATKKTEEAKAKTVRSDKVRIRLFRDNDKYKDDMHVIVNGKAWVIQRGVDVEVPVYVADVIEQSLAQDQATAEMIMEYEREARNMAEVN